MRKKIAKDRKARGEDYWNWGVYKIKKPKNGKENKKHTNKPKRIHRPNNKEI
jgi:hypothetical protein